eukprot:scaffold130241_cov65-Attheya_sp.AAC.13
MEREGRAVDSTLCGITCRPLGTKTEPLLGEGAFRMHEGVCWTSVTLQGGALTGYIGLNQQRSRLAKPHMKWSCMD